MQQDTDRDAAYLADLFSWIYGQFAYAAVPTSYNLRVLWFEGIDDMGTLGQAGKQQPYLGLYRRDDPKATGLWYAMKTSGAGQCPNMHVAQPLRLDQLFKSLTQQACY